MAEDYAYYLFVGDLPEVDAALKLLAATYRTSGNQLAADAVKAAYDRHLAQLINLAFNISVSGTDLLRERERSTRVRPDTQGRGGPRLGDHLLVDPLSYQGLPGSVGIANETVLDREVPWWSTNEQGSSSRVGGRVVGLFEPGDAPPNPLESREHSIFQPDRSGGLMTIRRPIPARRFIETSIPEIKTLWRAEFDALKLQLVAEVEVAGQL